MKLLDHYSEFRRALHTCEKCGWRGRGASMKSGSGNFLGINKAARCAGYTRPRPWTWIEGAKI